MGTWPYNLYGYYDYMRIKFGGCMKFELAAIWDVCMELTVWLRTGVAAAIDGNDTTFMVGMYDGITGTTILV